jgi:hypothetical protein
MANLDPREEHAYAVGIHAFIWGLPLVEMVRTCHVVTSVRAPQPNGRAPINMFGHCPRPWTHEDRDVVTPANDLLYSMAWLDLSAGPVVLSIPRPTGRYFVMALLDAYTNNFTNLGPRTVGSEGGRYAIIGPQSRDDIERVAGIVRSPTNLCWILGRVLIDGDDDLAAAHSFQTQFSLEANSRSGEPRSVREFDARGDALAFYGNLARAIADNPPPESERAVLALFEPIGLAPHVPFDRAALDPAVARGLERAFDSARAIVDRGTRSRGARPWGVSFKVGKFGTDYIVRAATAMKGLGGLAPEEAVYAMSDYDADGERLDGRNDYVLRFAADELPPAAAFWSVSLYGEDFYFVANPIRRYAIGDRTRGLVRDPDGSLTLYIQHRRPASGESNWLPAPSGRFYLILRIYHPKQEVLTRRYRIPAVRRADRS